MNLRCVVSGLFACAFAITALAAPASGGSCTQSPQSTPDRVVDVPNYRDADSAPDPEISAAEANWQRYQSSMIQSLRDSANPRHWAIAAMLGSSMEKTESAAVDDDLMNRATIAAPDDALVQWLAVSQAGFGRDDPGAPEYALRDLEPDNAAVWLIALNRAAHAKDATGVDVALERMADSKRFDLHYLSTVRLAAEAYRRFPETDFATAQMPGIPASPEIWAETMGFAFASMYTLPSFQSLVHACSVDPQTGANALHTSDCGRIGHLLVAHSDTYIAQRIGFAILRVSHTFTDDDVQIARGQDWIFAQRVHADSENTPQGAANFMRDFFATGNEIDAMRLAVTRAGKPLQPPADWVDARSPFSAERLANDARRATEYTDGPFY